MAEARAWDRPDSTAHLGRLDMTSMNASDQARMHDLAREALYTLQQVKSQNNDAEGTRRRLEAHLSAYQDFNDRTVKNYLALQRRHEEDQKRLDHIERLTRKKVNPEARHSRFGMGLKALDAEAAALARGASRHSDEWRTFWAWIAPESVKSIPGGLDLKTLRTDNQGSGGYLVPQLLDFEIRRNITEISPVRDHARVRMANTKSFDVPRRLRVMQARFEGEASPAQTDTSQYGAEQVTLYRQSVIVPATQDMMMSSAFDLEREVAVDVGETMAEGEGRAFLHNTAALGPQGLIADPRIEVVDTASIGELTFQDMANIAGKLKSGQRPWFFFSRQTLAKLWTIKSNIGVPVWQPAAGAAPATIWGSFYDSRFIDLDPAQNGSGAKPILFGDMRRGYEVYDMRGISVIRDDFTRKNEAITEWAFHRYLTGRVIIPEAFKVLRIKA